MSSLEERKMEEGRVGKGEEGELKELYYPRRNGWNCPWHPLQVLAWVFILFFSATYFGFLVFYIPGAWRSISYILGGGLFATYILASLVTSIVDPADASVRRRKVGGASSGGFLRAVFDRKKHKHVIEDRFCNLCNVNVTSSAKHCSVCDKCVEGFDHHCIWLNTCIGSRNYRWFMVTVFSALVACVLLLVFTLSLFFTFFSARDRLRYACSHHFLSANSSCSDDVRLFGATVPDPVFPVAVALIGLLALVGVAMIGYLAAFHVYLNVKGLTTYDYILLQRRCEREREEEARREQEASGQQKTREESQHSRWWFIRRKVNRVTPTDRGDVEKGQGGSSGVISASPSVNSVGLFNFGRTPAESLVGSSVGDMAVDEGTPPQTGHWLYGSQEKGRCLQEIVVEMESLPVRREKLPPVEDRGAALRRKARSGHGDLAVLEIDRPEESRCEHDVENGGILAFMSSANDIASVEGSSLASIEKKGNRSGQTAAVSVLEDLENCGTLAFMSSANSISTSGVPTGVQITDDENGGERSALVCGSDSLIDPNSLGGAAAAVSDTQRDISMRTLRNTEEGVGGASVGGGVNPTTESDKLREKGYEMLIKSGNTVGLRALKQLSAFTQQSSPPAERRREDTAAAGFHGYSNTLSVWERRQLHLAQELRTTRRDVWEYFPPPVKRSLTARQTSLPGPGSSDASGNAESSLLSLASAPALV